MVTPMALYKRGKVYWYEFEFNGQRYRASTDVGDQKSARQIEAAERVRLAKGKAGINERPLVPTVAEFAPRFETEIVTACAEKPDTVSFYKEKLRRLLEDPKIAGARLDQIDEAVVDGYKQRRTRQASRYGTPLSPASVNRELATLRRMLRLAQKWKILDRVPAVRMLRGEKSRDFIVSHKLEPSYLNAVPQPLKDVAILILETGLRVGEAVGLEWSDVYLQPAVHAKLGYIRIREGKSKNAKRNLSLSERAAGMLRARQADSESRWVFPGDTNHTPILGTSLDHQHSRVREALKLPDEFVLHSLRHTMLSRLGEAGADVFSIMRIAGHSSVTVSQRYVHPTPEGLERAFERLRDLNSVKFQVAEAESRAAAANGSGVPTKSPIAEQSRPPKSP